MIWIRTQARRIASLAGREPFLDECVRTVSAIDGAKPLRDQVALDSFDFLNVLIALKDRTGVDIPEKDYGRVQTLDDMAAYLCRRATVPG